MAATEDDLKEYFSTPGKDGLPSDVLLELQSIARLHSLPAQEVFFKWESYCIKMGSEETKLDYETGRQFKRDIQETLEKKHVHATPRAGAIANDVFGMCVGRQETLDDR